jgi:hypothetical protein
LNYYIEVINKKLLNDIKFYFDIPSMLRTSSRTRS